MLLRPDFTSQRLTALYRDGYVNLQTSPVNIAVPAVTIDSRFRHIDQADLKVSSVFPSDALHKHVRGVAKVI